MKSPLVKLPVAKPSPANAAVAALRIFSGVVFGVPSQMSKAVMLL